MGVAPVVGGEAGRFLELHLKMAAGEAAGFGNGFVGIVGMGEDELLGFLQAEVGEPHAESLAFHLTEVLHELSFRYVQSGSERTAVKVGYAITLLLTPVGNKEADVLFLLAGECRFGFFSGILTAQRCRLFVLGADDLAHIADVEAEGDETDDEEEESDEVEYAYNEEQRCEIDADRHGEGGEIEQTAAGLEEQAVLHLQLSGLIICQPERPLDLIGRIEEAEEDAEEEAGSHDVERHRHVETAVIHIAYGETGKDDHHENGDYRGEAPLEGTAACEADERIGEDADGGGIEQDIDQRSHIRTLGPEAVPHLQGIVNGHDQQCRKIEPAHLLILLGGVRLMEFGEIECQCQAKGYGHRTGLQDEYE